VTGPAKRKGDKAEREALDLLRDLGLDVHRNDGAGRPDDEADLTIENLVAVQVRDRADFGRACAEAALDAERQAFEAGVAYGVGLVRRRGGRWVVTMTPATFVAICAVLRMTRVAASSS
jgi:hypothetical protein